MTITATVSMTIIASIVGAIVAIYKICKFFEPLVTYNKEIADLKETIATHVALDENRDKLILSQARIVLAKELDKVLKEKKITTSYKMVLEELYEDYEASGGNGVIKDMRNKMLELNAE